MSGIIAAVGVVFLILLYVLYFTPVKNVSIVSARARSRYHSSYLTEDLSHPRL